MPELLSGLTSLKSSGVGLLLLGLFAVSCFAPTQGTFEHRRAPLWLVNSKLPLFVRHSKPILSIRSIDYSLNQSVLVPFSSSLAPIAVGGLDNLLSLDIQPLSPVPRSCETCTPDAPTSSMTLPTHIPIVSSLQKSPSMTLCGLSLASALRLGWYYLLLYFFTVVYNIANKQVLAALPLPATVSALQTFVGILLFVPLWLLKAPRNLNALDRTACMKIALCHSLGNLATVYALQSTSISFTHVVKSAEPLFAAILSVVVMKSSLSLVTYLSLLPIVIGVALASVKEFQFSWFAFVAAMCSNFFYQLRMVLSKLSLDAPQSGQGNPPLSAATMFRVITIFSFIQLLPIAWMLEGQQFSVAMTSLFGSATGRHTLMQLLLAGASFHCYNEVGFWILDLVHPVSQAVGNTVKRVVLVAVSVLVLRHPVSNLGLLGAAIAIAGSFVYALLASAKR